MAERGITLDDVETALAHPFGAPAPGDNGNLVQAGFAGGRLLKVVTSPDGGTLVSAYWST